MWGKIGAIINLKICYIIDANCTPHKHNSPIEALSAEAQLGAHMIGRAAHRHGVELCEGSVIDEYGDAYRDKKNQ